jgi:hypothetical protein
MKTAAVCARLPLRQVSPSAVYDYDMVTGERTLLKEKEVRPIISFSTFDLDVTVWYYCCIHLDGI